MANFPNNQTQVIKTLTKIETVFKERSISFTLLRRQILKLILESTIPAGAYDLLAKLKIEKSSIKPITVYRILDLFLQNNIIHKIKSQNKFLACSHPGANHDCWFLICDHCSIVQELCSNELKDMIDSKCRYYNFIPQKTILEINGCCNSCRSVLPST